LLPLFAIVALSVVGVSAAHVWLTSRLLRAAVDEQMTSVATTLNESTFPLEMNVLRQVRGLSGAELVLRDAEGQVLAASDEAFERASVVAANKAPVLAVGAVRLESQAAVKGETYFHGVTKLDRRGDKLLELYYPERTFREARWQAVYPSLVVGGVALVLAIALAGVVAARVTEPVQLLKKQTERIASGDFAPVQPPPRDDELRDLALAVNRMAGMLQHNAEELRRHERSAALNQVGAGIAHQLRNAATGCRMALDLYQRQQRGVDPEENLLVATRQLELMESYLQRFLTLGRTTKVDLAPLDVNEVIASAVTLVRPLAEHRHATVETPPNGAPHIIFADRKSLEQVFVNLLTNAVEACAVPEVSSPRVAIAVHPAGEALCITIADNGPGFAPRIAGRLGEPFVTTKPEGTGLGLAVAREILAASGASLAWRREGAWTKFEVTFDFKEIQNPIVH
jgi:nitrogen fixation/metabolism regulation signal transduction histidine kinase